MVKIDSIAIIEDDEKVRNYLCEQILLHIDVKELRSFGDAESALKKLSAEPVDIALFDINLPGMNERRAKLVSKSHQSYYAADVNMSEVEESDKVTNFGTFVACK